MVDVTEDSLERLYDKIHLEEINRGGRMGEIRLRVVRRFNQEAGLTAQSAELEALRGEVERLTYNGIHTCSDTCQRLPCVQRREIDQLRARVAALEEGLRHIIKQWPDSFAARHSRALLNQNGEA